MAKTCKYLPARGWTPLVLSGPMATDVHAPVLDPELLNDVHDTEVIRVSGAASSPWLHPLRALRFSLGMDEWIDRSIPIANRLAQEGKLDAVLTSLSPFSGWRLGRELQARHRLPWILDLRDPWALDGWRSWRTPLHSRWDLLQMQRALRSADAVIANTPEAAKAYLELGAERERLCVIPNGFDPTDFGPPLERERGRPFVLVHIGTFHSASSPSSLTRNGLLWRNRQVAPLGRSGHYLIRALALLRARAPELAAAVRVELHGVVHPSHHELARRLGVADLVHHMGYSSHPEALRALASADASFVGLHGVPPGERALVVPAKLYEALASGRPTLAALPPGDGADLVRLVAGGPVVPPCDEGALAGALEGMVRESLQGQPLRGCKRAWLEPFERARLTDSIAETLDRTSRGESLEGLPDPWQQVSALV